MNEINRLSTDISNKIAAGEVAENPFHVVKELVENSLDAGATVIHVAIQNGGLGSIIVRDNGIGVLPQDMAQTVERFCTSKIKDFYDPGKITTMGFRGEALAAISSVSEFEMHSMRKGHVAKRLTVSSNSVVSVVDAEPISGTRIIARNLFYNVPARRKFMKTPGHYTREITRFIKLFATVNLEIEVKLTCDSKETFLMKQHMPFNARAAHMLNNNNILVSETTANEATVLIATTDPTVQKPRRNGIMFAINGRVVNDPYLTNAVVQAYHRLIPANTYPLSVVLILMNTAEIDVNVHPNKLEIKLLNQRSVFSLVHRGVLKALADATIPTGAIPTGVNTRAIPTGVNTGAIPTGAIPTGVNTRAIPTGAIPTNTDAGTSTGAGTYSTYDTPKASVETGVEANVETGKYRGGGNNPYPTNAHGGDDDELFLANIRSYQGGNAHGSHVHGGNVHGSNVHGSHAHDSHAHGGNVHGGNAHGGNVRTHESMATQPEQPQLSNDPLTPLAQLGNMFILCSNANNDLVIVDQHIAHERVLYEKLQLDQNTQKPTMLLHTPVEVHLSQEERDTLADHGEFFAEKGFTFAIGDSDAAVSDSDATVSDVNIIHVLQAPMEISKTDVARSVRKILTELAQGSSVSLLDKTNIFLSCRKAIKAGDPLNLFEMQDLLHQLAQTSNPLTCPHGRPIMVPITMSKIKTMFGR